MPRARHAVITAAQPSYADAYRARKKRYFIMMGMRVPALIAAALLYQTPWLAILVVVLSIPLPWCAVLIANDGPARDPLPYAHAVDNGERALPPPSAAPYELPPEVVEGD